MSIISIKKYNRDYWTVSADQLVVFAGNRRDCKKYIKERLRILLYNKENTMNEIVSRLHEARQVERAKALLEANGYTLEKIDESWPPILNSLNKAGRDRVRVALKRLGIDIENTPYEEIALSGARDPRIKDPQAMLIFPLKSDVRHYGNDVAVWVGGQFVVDTDIFIGSSWEAKSLQRMSWKSVMEVTDNPIMIKFDADISAAMKDKQDARKESQAGMVKRYTKEELNKMSYSDRRKFRHLDKSGYEVNPNKYKDMLAAMKIKDGDKILADAKEVYVKLAQNLSRSNMDDRSVGTFESYQYLIRQIPEQFNNLSRALDEYNGYKAEHENDGDEGHKWWTKNLENQVKDAINEMRDLVKKAEKYM